MQPDGTLVILLIAANFFGMWGLIQGVPVAIYLIRVTILNSAIPGIYESQRRVALAGQTEPDDEYECGI